MPGPSARARPVGPAAPARHPRGVTLVELLVVVAVIATAVGAVVLALPDPRGALSDEAETLAARLSAARDSAILARRSVAVRFDEQGYAVERREPAGWVAMPGRAFAARDWPPGVTVELTPPGQARVRFDATGLATPATVQLLRDGMAVAVTVDPAGEVSVDAPR
jgi:general secretion pathway protein H